MPTDDAYDAVLAELGKLHEGWRIHRDTINRAVSLLNHEVISFTERLNKDDAAREKRQAQLDEVLTKITTGQERMRVWQWVRLGVEVGAIIAAFAFWYGVTR